MSGRVSFSTMEALLMPPRTFSTATTCLARPSALPIPAPAAAPDTKVTEDSVMARPKLANIGR